MDNGFDVFYEITAGEWAGEIGSIVEFKNIIGSGRRALIAFDDGGFSFVPLSQLPLSLLPQEVACG